MRFFSRLCVLSLLLLVAGCVGERIVWSPDGKRAAVLGDDGLHVCDVTGKLSPVLVANATCAAWLPDSKRSVVSTQKIFSKWQDASRALPDEVETARNNVSAVRDELAAATDWSKFFNNTKQKLHLSDLQLTLTVMCVRDASAGVLGLKMDQKGKDAYKSQQIRQDVLQVYELGDSGATAGPVLYQQITTGRGIENLRVSPNGKGVLVSCNQINPGSDEQELKELLLASTDGSKKVVELGRGAMYPDWSADGRYVVYITPADWNSSRPQVLVGVLARQQVTDDSGNYLDAAQRPAREDLAGLLFNELARVRVAKDGRIFFSAAEINLPAAVKDFDSQATVFSFDPGKQSTLTRVVPRSALQTVGDAAQYFELSPDARYLSIPFGDGRVSVLDIASGEARIVQPESKHETGKQSELASVPVWRTATELTFVRPRAGGKGGEAVRYSMTDSSATVISTDWPASVGGWVAPQPAATKSDVPSAKK
jgi:hypothetical protein